MLRGLDSIGKLAQTMPTGWGVNGLREPGPAPQRLQEKPSATKATAPVPGALPEDAPDGVETLEIPGFPREKPPAVKLADGEGYVLPNGHVVLAIWDQLRGLWILNDQNDPNVLVAAPNGEVFLSPFGLASIEELDEYIATGWTVDDLAELDVELDKFLQEENLPVPKKRPAFLTGDTTATLAISVLFVLLIFFLLYLGFRAFLDMDLSKPGGLLPKSQGSVLSLILFDHAPEAPRPPSPL